MVKETRGQNGGHLQQLQPKALSLFAGCGGFCEGVELSGFNVVAAVEKDPFACQTYRFNFPGVSLYEGDIANFNKIPVEELIEAFNLEDLTLVFGGPPCQGYSQIGTRDLEDPRNTLYLEYKKVIERLKPPIFVMENVPNMALLRKGMFKSAAIEAFRNAGYAPVECVLLVASDFGVPQERWRMFYFGVRRDLHLSSDLACFLYDFFESQKVFSPPTVWEAIGDLPAEVVESGETAKYPLIENPSLYMKEMRLDYNGKVLKKDYKKGRGISHFSQVRLYNHHTKEIQSRRLELIKHLKPGCKANTLPKHLWDGTRPEKWRRLHPDKVSHTILAQMHRDLSEFVHPTLHRWITVREALRLQSFHDGFIPVTSEWQQLKQIGNAVPPMLARVVGLAAGAIMSEVGLKMRC